MYEATHAWNPRASRQLACLKQQTSSLIRTLTWISKVKTIDELIEQSSLVSKCTNMGKWHVSHIKFSAWQGKITVSHSGHFGSNYHQLLFPPGLCIKTYLYTSPYRIPVPIVTTWQWWRMILFFKYVGVGNNDWVPLSCIIVMEMWKILQAQLKWH